MDRKEVEECVTLLEGEIGQHWTCECTSVWHNTRHICEHCLKSAPPLHLLAAKLWLGTRVTGTSPQPPECSSRPPQPVGSV